MSEIADIMLQIVEGHPLCVSWSSKHPTDSSHVALDMVNDQATKDDLWMIWSPEILLMPLLYYCLYGQLQHITEKTSVCSAQYLDLKKNGIRMYTLCLSEFIV